MGSATCRPKLTCTSLVHGLKPLLVSCALVSPPSSRDGQCSVYACSSQRRHISRLQFARLCPLSAPTTCTGGFPQWRCIDDSGKCCMHHVVTIHRSLALLRRVSPSLTLPGASTGFSLAVGAAPRSVARRRRTLAVFGTLVNEVASEPRFTISNRRVELARLRCWLDYPVHRKSG